MGEEPIQRTFWSLGYDYEFLVRMGDQNHEDIFRAKIIESIEKKRPVIAYGIVGPPDEGIVAGYDKKGQILIGRSYFHDSSKGYYEKDEWYKDCLALLLIGERKTSPENRDIYRKALEWSVKLAHTRNCTILAKNNQKHLIGFAAFDAWIEALKNDIYFPKDDMDELTLACQIHGDVTLSGLFDSRRAAVGFLKGMVDEFQTCKADILKATGAYEEELELLQKGLKLVPFSYQTKEQRSRIADPALRANLTDFILKAKGKEIEAITHIEQALEKKK